MGAYVDGYDMGKFSLFYASVQPVAPLCMHWPLAQPFHVAWADSTGQCSVYISLMSMAAIMNGHNIKNSSTLLHAGFLQTYLQ